MRDKSIKKTVFTLNIDGYCPEVTELTFPLLKRYAKKIGADFHVIDQRKFPDYPPVYEKIQIYQLSQEMQNDWNIYIDADALVCPDTPDFTTLIKKDTVMHNGSDFAPIRWRYDKYFLRDGRHIGSCNWLAVASDLCTDLWHPLEDLTFLEAKENIFPVISEELSGVMDSSHLIDDYVLSRNIARYGLKFKTFLDVQKESMGGPAGWLWHKYAVPNEEKVREMKDVLRGWRLI
jgi:hypothetical protein